ncbi:MAG: hypothetical protein V4494_05845 [Chlamydiota bacterium]
MDIRRATGAAHTYTQVKNEPYPGESKEKVKDLLARAGQTTQKKQIKSLINRANASPQKGKETKVFARVVSR